mmetsp:Transcript_18974/g.28299  ORF Transcript_18974/g.28299 Transcript_18974/m.28299 type:complete len:119 (-) Transcript_18974:121-477(-)
MPSKSIPFLPAVTAPEKANTPVPKRSTAFRKSDTGSAFVLPPRSVVRACLDALETGPLAFVSGAGSGAVLLLLFECPNTFFLIAIVVDDVDDALVLWIKSESNKQDRRKMMRKFMGDV